MMGALLGHRVEGVGGSEDTGCPWGRRCGSLTVVSTAIESLVVHAGDCREWAKAERARTAADGFFRRMTHAEVSREGETAEEFSEPETRCRWGAHTICHGTDLIRC
jgi:hypothetical protein